MPVAIAGLLLLSLLATMPLATASVTGVPAGGDAPVANGMSAFDNDSLNQSEEQRYGTDPNDWDTDNDTIPDGWEVAGETPSGIPLPGANPLRRDYYYTVIVADGEGPLSESRLTDLRQFFKNLPVENPDKTTGVNLHIIEIRQQDNVVINSSERYEKLAQETRGNLTERTSLYGTLVLVDFDWKNRIGFASVGGGFATAERRDDAIYHELLHNLLGTLPPYVARCSGDPTHYCGGQAVLNPTTNSGDSEKFPAELGTVFERSSTASGYPFYTGKITTNATLVQPGEPVSVQLDQWYIRNAVRNDSQFINLTDKIDRVRIFGGNNTSYFRELQPTIQDRTFTIEINRTGTFDLYVESGNRTGYTEITVKEPESFVTELDKDDDGELDRTELFDAIDAFQNDNLDRSALFDIINEFQSDDPRWSNV